MLYIHSFDVTINLNFTGKGLPNEIGILFSYYLVCFNICSSEVEVALREVQLNGEERIFFYGNGTRFTELVQTVTLNPTGVATVKVYQQVS